MTGWNVDTLAHPSAVDSVTIVEGSSFSVSDTAGDIRPEVAQGVFFHDTRLISRWLLLVDGMPVEPLSAMTPQPYRATFVGRAGHIPGRADTLLIVERDRHVGAGLREDLTLRSFAREPMLCRVELVLEADFADIFEVKEGRVRSSRSAAPTIEGTRIVVETHRNGRRHGMTVVAPEAAVIGNRLAFDAVIPPRGTWSRTLHVVPTAGGGEEISVAFPDARPVHESEPARRFLSWHAHIPVPSVEDDAVEQVLAQSHRDLGSLRIFIPDDPDRSVVAAGAPWFMALFGRDSLLSAFMALPLDSTLATGTLRSLAELQGSRVDPVTEEQPGRILHEVRLGARSHLALGGGTVYYGTADATPLFVVLLGELARWGALPEEADDLIAAADRAIEWIERYGDANGDGFVEYARLNAHGLINQGWKDSWDGVTFADGDIAEAPIALCEVQGYVYAAYLARALIARSRGDARTAERCEAKARALKIAFNERFWMPDRGCFALAIDGNGRQVDSCTSNMGHCLWSGIVDEDKAGRVAEHLISDRMFTGWGVRTLASDMAAYNPASYHNGSVWPHDSAIVAAGLMRYGFVQEAQAIIVGLFEAATAFGGRLPELFCGFDRGQYAEPVAYPASCSPQAWAAASPFLLLRTLLRLDPSVPTGELWLAPTRRAGSGDVTLSNLPIAGAQVEIRITDGEIAVHGLPSSITVRREPRPATQHPREAE